MALNKLNRFMLVWWLEYVSCALDKKKHLCWYFSRLYSRCLHPRFARKKKFRGPRVEGDINDQGPRAEKKKYLNFEQSLAEG